MHGSILAFAALAGLARALVVPETPVVVNEGQQMTIVWTPDTTGQWTSMNILLRSGSNQNMQTVTTVATGVNGVTSSTLQWTVPAVDPNSAIYFLEFNLGSSDAAGAPQWTTRFAIPDASGATTPPANANQEDGEPIPWGIGALANGAAASSVPASSSASSASSSASSSSSAASSARSSSASTASSASGSSRSSSGSASSSRTSSAPSQSVSSNVFSPGSGAIKATGSKIAGVGMVLCLAVSAILL